MLLHHYLPCEQASFVAPSRAPILWRPQKSLSALDHFEACFSDGSCSFLTWIHLDWFLATWLFREAGFDSLGSLASRPRLGDTPSVEAFNVIIFLRSMSLGHCTAPSGLP